MGKIATEATLNNLYRANRILAGIEMGDVFTNYRKIQGIVRSGFASDVFHVGDVINTTANFAGTEYVYPFVVVDFRDVTLRDGSTVPGMVLMAKYATPYGVQFDAAEPSNADANIQQYGYNRWSQSAYRQWLNSAAGVNAWWTAQSDTDVAPEELSTVAGFMASFNSDFLSVLGKTQIQTATNTATDGGVIDTTYDTFWLPSIEEMYGVPQVSGEGSYFPYIKIQSGLSDPSNDACSGRRIYGIDNTSAVQLSRLRSALREDSYRAWFITENGNVYPYAAAISAMRCTPVCVIC